MPEPPPARTARTLQGLAEEVGAYRWFERRLFELTGRWAAGDALASAQLYFDRSSSEHAWHADLWAERLPVLAGLDPEALTAPPGSGVARLLDDLAAEGEGPERTVVRLAGFVRVVLPRLLVTYRLRLEGADPVAERPVARVLRLVLADGTATWEEGERLLEGQLVGAGAVERAAQVQARLERHLAREGAVGLTGPWGGGPGPPRAKRKKEAREGRVS